jgi:hypothetical protein
MSSSYVKFNICVLCRHWFYVSLLLGGWCCRAVTPTSDAPAERGHPPVMRLWGGDARRWQSGRFWVIWKGGWSGEQCPCGRLMPGRGSRPAEKWCSILKNPLNLKTPAGAVFSPRATLLHTYVGFIYEDDLTIKIKYVAGTSRTIYLST